ncbi:hypothetical protein EDE12_12910 [Methylosinus sp. sav-2]|nr:hypothetical protein EDE12_12910 [Methylosinus sp. sav-2]
MIMPDPATFAAEAEALHSLHSASSKAINAMWRRTGREALKAHLDRPIGGVTAKMIYGAIGIAAEMLNDPSQRAALEARGDAMPTVDPPAIDTTPCDLVLVLPQKPSPALAQMLIELGLTCHTDARRTHGIACCLWQGRAAPSIVIPLVEAVRGQVIAISLPPSPNGAESDTSSGEASDDDSDRREPEVEGEGEGEPAPSVTVARRRGRPKAEQKSAAQNDAATSAPVTSTSADTPEGERLQQDDAPPIIADDNVEIDGELAPSLAPALEEHTEPPFAMRMNSAAPAIESPTQSSDAKIPEFLRDG